MQNKEQRHISLDAMRGFAVMGILAMNIIGFAMPEWAYVTPAAYGTDTLADKIAWVFSFIFIDGKNAATLVNDEAWMRETFIPTVAKRGAAIIKARGLSSAASAGTAAIDHIRNWVQGTPAGDWVSMSVPSDGSYGVPAGLISSFPCTCANGEYSIVQGLPINDFSRKMIDASVAELIDERDAVRSLGLV